MNTKLMIMIGLIVMSMFLIGCAVQPKDNNQIANPASVYCQDNGGTLKIIETAEGQQGICTLKDGTECDEWQYFRGECPGDASLRHICTDEESLNTACTADYNPVCGEILLNAGNTVYQTFGNGCSACAAMKVVSYTPGECPSTAPVRHICTDEEKAAQMCTLEYMPVCGIDGITYGNKCGACAADIDSWISGECPAHVCTAEEKANQACTKEYMPVCGSDGVTYGNKCTACSAGIDSWVLGECAK